MVSIPIIDEESKELDLKFFILVFKEDSNLLQTTPQRSQFYKLKKRTGRDNKQGLSGCHFAKTTMNYQLKWHSTYPVSGPTTNGVWIKHLDPIL